MTNFFSPNSIWNGGSYELAIEIGPRCDEALVALLSAVWSSADLEGPYLDNSIEPSGQNREVVAPNLLQNSHLYGLARMPDGSRVACGTFVIREENGSDWLGLFLPTGSLQSVYPFKDLELESTTELNRPYRELFDDLFAKIGIAVYNKVPFKLALIGFEVSGDTSATVIAQEGIPEMRYCGYLCPKANDLTYFPRNQQMEPNSAEQPVAPERADGLGNEVSWINARPVNMALGAVKKYDA